MQTIITEILAEVRVLELTDHKNANTELVKGLSPNGLIELAASCILQLKKTAPLSEQSDPNQLTLDL